MKTKLIIKQISAKDCGAASVLSIIRYYGGNIPLNNLIEYLKIDQNGTNFLNISNYLTSIGLVNKSYKLDNTNEIKKLNMPVLLQVVRNNMLHFVVLYEIKSEKFIIMDPALGEIKISAYELNHIWTGNVMIFHLTNKLPRIKERNYLKEIIEEVLRKNKLIIIGILFSSIIFALFSCFSSYYFKIILDSYKKFSFKMLMIIMFIFLLISFIKILFNYLRNKMLIIFAFKMDFSLVTKMLQKILLFPYTYYKKQAKGEILSKVNDLSYIKDMIMKFILTVFLDGFFLLIGMFFLMTVNLKLFIVSLLSIFFYVGVILIFKKKKEVGTLKNLENSAYINNLLVEDLNSVESIKNLFIHEEIIQNFKDKYLNSSNDLLKYDFLNNKEIFWKNFFNEISSLIILTYGVILTRMNVISVGELITYQALLNYFLEPIKNILDLDSDYHYAVKSFKRANALFCIESEELVSKNNFYLEGNIYFNNLSFSHDEENFLIKNLNLSIKKGEKVLLSGKSGIGKSTILKIIYKYYDIPSKMIYLNNIDLNNYSKADIRLNIGYLSQNEFIYTDTLYNNIVLGRNIAKEDFLKICYLTEVDDIFKDNFLGYNMVLEDNGSNISGGQRARVLLARLLVKKANIIMIDEGLNEMDVSLERRILKRLWNFYPDTTFLIVSHRMNNLDLFDKKIDLNNYEVISK